MTNEQLNAEFKKNLTEIETIHKQIPAQAAAKNPVAAMYERINYLTDRNGEIESLLVQMGDYKTAGTDTQLDKAISIVGGGAVSIRPTLDEPDDSGKSTIVNSGNKIAATSAQQPSESNTQK